jgi:hypothetical protein
LLVKRKEKEILAVTGLAILGFAVTFAVVSWVQREPGARLALPARASVGRVWSSLVSHSSTPPSPVAAAAPAPSRPAMPAAAEQGIEVPPSDDAGPPLPVMLAFSSHPGDADADNATPPGPAGVVRQVDLYNTSDEPLAVTVLALDVPTQETTRAQVFMSPHALGHVGTEAGLKLDPGNQVALRSRGYRELTGTVR